MQELAQIEFQPRTNSFKRAIEKSASCLLPFYAIEFVEFMACDNFQNKLKSDEIKNWLADNVHNFIHKAKIWFVYNWNYIDCMSLSFPCTFFVRFVRACTFCRRTICNMMHLCKTFSIKTKQIVAYIFSFEKCNNGTRTWRVQQWKRCEKQYEAPGLWREKGTTNNILLNASI